MVHTVLVLDMVCSILHSCFVSEVQSGCDWSGTSWLVQQKLMATDLVYQMECKEGYSSADRQPEPVHCAERQWNYTIECSEHNAEPSINPSATGNPSATENPAVYGLAASTVALVFVVVILLLCLIKLRLQMNSG